MTYRILKACACPARTTHSNRIYLPVCNNPIQSAIQIMRNTTDQGKTGFHLPLRVYYQDTDAGGVVYHSTYLDYMERARYEWLRTLGFTIHSLLNEYQIIFMVRAVHIEYFKPAVLDDLLHIGVSVTELGRSRIQFSQQILRDNTDTCLTRAAIDIVCVGAKTLKPARLPDAVRKQLEGVS